MCVYLGLFIETAALERARQMTIITILFARPKRERTITYYSTSEFAPRVYVTSGERAERFCALRRRRRKYAREIRSRVRRKSGGRT